MKSTALAILRIGLGITFVWIGVYIVQDPLSWSGYIQPWVRKFLLASPEQVMFVNGLFDITLGALLLFNIWTWFASLLAAIHLVIVLIASGINSITVRDIGLLGAALALSLQTKPENLFQRFLGVRGSR